MRIDSGEHVIVKHSIPITDIMLPAYKMQQSDIYADYTAREDVRRQSRLHERSERPDIDTSAFEELVRRVDWLYEEVRYIKQTLDDYRRSNSSYEQPSYRSYEPPSVPERGRQDAGRPDVMTTSSERVRYYEQPPPRVTRESIDHGYIITTTAANVIYPTSRRFTRSEGAYDDVTSQTMSTRTFPPLDVIPKNERETTYGSDSPSSSIIKTEKQSSELFHGIPDDVTIAEIVVLWEKGMNDVPPVVEWDVQDKMKYKEKLEIFFKIHHIFRVSCNGDISHFASKYTDNMGHMRSPAFVASLCPDVSENFEIFLQTSKVLDSSTDKVYTLPRKINGRKVSAKDVIQLWEYGMGDVPPIKSWTKPQKFKQQSKISRWKKIVDIFKYQCTSDMRKFEEIYTDSHGCLLPVAAITNKFETLYGDELNITSKLMTVTTNEHPKQQQQQPITHDEVSTGRKRKLTEESLSDMESSAHSSHNHNQQYEEQEGYVRNTTSTLPPLLVSAPPKLIKREEEHHYQSPNNVTKINGESSTPSSSTANIRLSTDKKDGTPSQQQYDDDQSSPSSTSDVTNDENNDHPPYKRSTSVIYILPDTITLKEAISFWENGSQDFPPVKTWTHVQNSIQQDLIVNIERLYYIYSEHFHQDRDAFLASSINEKGEEMNMEVFLAKYHDVREDSRNVKSSSANSMTFDFSHHKTITQSTDALYLLPRKINGRKVSAKDVLQLWYHGLNKIPPVKQWSPQQKAVQQSKISRWKKIVELFEQDFSGDWEKFQKHYSNSLGQLLPITAIISKHEEESRSMIEGAYHPTI